VSGVGEHSLSKIIVDEIRGIEGHVVVDIIIQRQNHVVLNGSIVAAGIQLKYAVNQVAVVAAGNHQIELVAFGFHRALVPVDADAQIVLNPLIALHVGIAGHQIGKVVLNGNPVAQLQSVVKQREVIALLGVGRQLAGFCVGVRYASLSCCFLRCCG